MIADKRWKYDPRASASGRCCSILKTTRRNCATLAPMRPTRSERQRLVEALAALGPAPVAAHDALRAADHRDARQIGAPRHPDRRVGRARTAGRTLEQLPGEQGPGHCGQDLSSGHRRPPPGRRPDVPDVPDAPDAPDAQGWTPRLLNPSRACDRPAPARCVGAGAIGVAPADRGPVPKTCPRTSS